MFAIVICACQPKLNTAPANKSAAKVAVSELFDKYHSAIMAKQVNTMAVIITDNVLICGTDPSEFLNKKAIVDLWTKEFSDTSFKVNYTIDKREIRISLDGSSAVVIEQLIIPLLSPKIPVRLISHVVKVADNWKIDFFSPAPQGFVGHSPQKSPFWRLFK
jgi:ketosteroid isomerase-like protein